MPHTPSLPALLHSCTPALLHTKKVALSVYTALFGMPVVFDMIFNPFGVYLPLSADAPVNKALHYCICVHFLSKFLDYVDTLLIIIGKKDKQLSVLHVYHHCSISMVWGYLINIPIAYGTICVRFALTPRFTQSPLYDPRLTD